MIDTNEFIENSKKNDKNSVDITKHLTNVLENYEENKDKIVNENLDKVLDKNLEESSKIYEEALKSNINVIENFLQDLNKEDVISSLANTDLNNTEPISNLNERINHVKELLNTLPPDDEEIYTNKVLNAVSELNKKILNKAMPAPEHDYDFER